ncbi:MAG: hypothetical protein V4671_12785 [Armatimonadota bacterium]
MNLRHQAKSEATTHEKPWYQQPETTVEVPEVTEVPAESSQAAQGVQQSQTHHEPLFDQAAAERILARAGALQEVQGSMLYQEQVEAVAAEIGIKPEFVHLAIEQDLEDKNAAVRKEHETAHVSGARREERVAPPTFLAIGAYVVLATLLSMLAYRVGYYGLFYFMWIIFPAILALGLGYRDQTRRRGSVTGAAVGLTVITSWAMMYSYAFGWRVFPSITPSFALIIVAGTLLGLTGAQARRMVSRLRRR